MRLPNSMYRHIVALAACSCLCGVALAQTAREVAKKVSPSVVLLVMEDGKGQPLAMGSGFVIKDGIVATNLHVVEGASRGYAKLADRKEKFNIRGTVGIDAARDIVLLSVEDIKADALPLGDSKQVAVGDEVYAVGNPRGLEGTFSAGIISSIRKVGDDSLLQITAPISPGSSGGPVVNNKGEVVGIAVATFKGGQNLNFAIPSAYLSSLASAMTPAVPLAGSRAEAKPKPKSIFEDLGGRSTDGVTAGQFLWEYPASQTGHYSVSLRNQLREPVKNVSCLLVFFGRDGQPVETGTIKFTGIIAPGLAKRVKGKVDGSVKKLTGNGDAPKTKLEFRILYFDLATDDETQNERGGVPRPVPVPIEAPDSKTKPPPSDRPGVVRPQDAEDALRKAEKELAEAVAKFAPAGNGPDLIESRIEGTFEGWDGDTIFKLENGQIWQQVTFGYTYRYAFRPEVFIIKTHGAYKMKVDGVSGTIFVKQIK